MPGRRTARPDGYPAYQQGLGQPSYAPQQSPYLDEGLAATAAAYSNLSPGLPHGFNSHPYNSTSHASSSRIPGPSLGQPSTLQYSPTSENSQGESEASGSEGSAPQHRWIQVADVTTTRHLSHLVVEGPASDDGTRTFYCGYQGCAHPVGFPHKTQLVTHIRSVHLQEKPFFCTTCKTPFARKQDAVRHVTTANSGQRYPCNICDKTFARKSYRDSHQDLCVQRTMITNYNRVHAARTTSPQYSPHLHYPPPHYRR